MKFFQVYWRYLFRSHNWKKLANVWRFDLFRSTTSEKKFSFYTFEEKALEAKSFFPKCVQIRNIFSCSMTHVPISKQVASSFFSNKAFLVSVWTSDYSYHKSTKISFLVLLSIPAVLWLIKVCLFMKFCECCTQYVLVHVSIYIK